MRGQLSQLKTAFRSSKLILSLGFVISLVSYLLVSQYLEKQLNEKNKLLFSKISDDVRLAFEQYIHPLQGISSTLHYSHLKFSAINFRSAAQSRNFFKNFKGAIGFGFIKRVKAFELKSFLKTLRSERPGFQLKRLKQSPDLENDDLFIIMMIEPVETNDKALGLVISDERNRREAAINAMRTGRPWVTKSIELVQNKTQGPGLLLYLPIYKTVSTPNTELEREQMLIGWAYAPLLVTEVVKFVHNQNINSLPFRIFETKGSNKTKLYEDKRFPKEFNQKKYLMVENLNIAGQNWEIHSIHLKKDIFFNDIISTLLFLFLISITFSLSFYLRSIESKIQYQKEIISASEKAVLQATVELQEQRNFLQTVINELPAMIGYWDKNLINRLSNSMYKKYFNKDTHEIYGKHISELLPEEVFLKNLPFMKNALNGITQEFERELIATNGDKKTVLAKYHPHFKDSEVLGFTVIVLDITHIRKLEEENKENQALLFAKSKLSILGEMAGGIAHEINNPLTIITGKAESTIRIINKNTLDEREIEKIKSNATSIMTTVERISKIIKGLKSFSRDSENDPYTQIPIKDIIEDTLSLTREKFKNRNIQITVDEAHLEQLLICNKVQIGQVVMNLISNSLDAISGLDEKWIKIKIEDFGDFWKIRLIDSGKGIPLSIVDKMMNPFFTTKEVGKGTGLGLSISKGIMEKHNGHLSYELFEGHTSFLLTLPKVQHQMEVA